MIWTQARSDGKAPATDTAAVLSAGILPVPTMHVNRGLSEASLTETILGVRTASSGDLQRPDRRLPLGGSPRRRRAALAPEGY